MPLPPDCSVASLAAWLNPFWAPSATIFRESEAMARAVRELVEAKVREALTECPIDQPTGDEILARVLGAP